MNLLADLVDPLHEEIPHWSWLADGRELFTMAEELVTLAAHSCVRLYLSQGLA